ncbi:MAG: hypothetical protein LC745_12455, partial [Planctomycetia bacterium]|nr:hypothetical protein [Planctomycetia bacterium]
MFALPRYVVKAGEVVVDGGELRSSAVARTLHVAPGYDPEILPEIEEWFARDYSLQFANYPVGPDDVANPLDCTGRPGETQRGGA